MSLRALTWAMEHPDCPSSSAKLVLLAFANFANEQHWAYPSTETIARLTKLDPKTVRSATDLLEGRGIIVDTGKRAGATRQVKVYRLSLPERHPETGGLPKAPDFGGVSDRKASGFSGKGPRNRVAEPVSEPLPPSDPDGSDTPKGDDEPAVQPSKSDRVRGSRIPDGWTPPAVDQLPPKALELARQWPAGAYAAEGEAFANYWAGEGGAKARKVDWAKTWANWVVSVSAKVLRAEKAGVKHGTPTAAASPVPVAAVIVSKEGECEASRRIRDQLRRAMGDRTYDAWLKPAALIVEDGRLVTVWAPSTFARSWLEQHFGDQLRRAGRSVIGDGFADVRWEVARGDRILSGSGSDGHGEGNEDQGKSTGQAAGGGGSSGNRRGGHAARPIGALLPLGRYGGSPGRPEDEGRAGPA